MFKKILFLILLCSISFASAKDNEYPETIWEQLPKSTKERFEFFKKVDRTGAFDTYKDMRGTKIIFACVNAYTFVIIPLQKDDITNIGEAKHAADEACSVSKRPFKNDIDNEALQDIPLALGTPILLDFYLDEDANESYRRVRKEYQRIYTGDDFDLFIHRKNVMTNKKHIKSSWMIRSHNKKVPEVHDALSVKYIKEINCKMMRSRMVDLIVYEGKYGTGDVKWTHSQREWRNIVPGTVGEDVAKIICSR